MTGKSQSLPCVCVAWLTFCCTTGMAADRRQTVSPRMTQRQIQDVLDEARPDSTVVFAAGTYRVQDALRVAGKQRVTLRGRGAVTVICDNRFSNVIEIDDCTGVTLDGLHLTHTDPGDGTVCVGHVVFVSTGDMTTIRNCNLDGCGAVGIYAYTRNVVVTGCHIHSCSVRPIEFSGVSLELRNNLLESGRERDFVLMRAVDRAEPLFVGRHNVDQAQSEQLRLRGNTLRIQTSNESGSVHPAQ